MAFLPFGFFGQLVGCAAKWAGDHRRAGHQFDVLGRQRAAAGFAFDGIHADIAGQLHVDIDDIRLVRFGFYSCGQR